MSAKKYMHDPATGRCAVFTENGTSGAFDDPAAARNAPLNSPLSYLPNLCFHSDMDHFEVLFAGSGSITYGSIAGIGNPQFLASAYGVDAGFTDNVLLSFGTTLAQAPFALVAVGANIMWPGMPLYNNSDGGATYGTAYTTPTELHIWTKSTIGGSTLSGQTITFDYLVFAEPPAASGSVLLSFDPSLTSNKVTLGKGKFQSGKQYLQVVPGGSPLGLFGDRCIDLDNGAPRAWRPDGTTYDTVPSGLKSYLPYLTFAGGDLGGETLGNSMAYGGSYAGPGLTVDIQAP